MRVCLDPCSSQPSSSGQLQETLLQLRESSRDKTLLTQQVRQRESEVRHLEKALALVRGEKEGLLVRTREQLEAGKRASEVHILNGDIIFKWCD